MFGRVKKNQKHVSDISLRLQDCIAKTFNRAGTVCLGQTVRDHCLIVGRIARELVTRMPPWLQNALFPEGVELVAAAHDIGKICPTFQKKIYQAANVICHLPSAEYSNPEEEANWGWHQGVSQIAAAAYGLGKYIPKILGKHHGKAPVIRNYNERNEALGGLLWQSCREECLAILQDTLGGNWPILYPIQEPIIAGLTTVADWIGSGSAFDDPQRSVDIKKAVEEAGFVQPIVCPDLTFAEIFDFKPLPAQEAFFVSCQKPGIYILEAPMGYGKTEAALYAAYQLLTSNQATGIYFALPTQLTSDAMYGRVCKFLQRISQEYIENKLLHGHAWLYETDMGADAAPGASWFNSNKRGILAPVAIGTLDQALLSVIHAKHNFVRAFGLAGKVVVIDEAHSYDLYTGTLLEDLVANLRKWECTVIILSATLTKDKRAQLMQMQPTSEAYPLVSAIHSNILHEIPVQSLTSAEVMVRSIPEETLAIEEALLRAEQGQQVLWIENSVAESQAVYRTLAARGSSIGILCGLLHARFLKNDRKRIEDTWVPILGKEGGSCRTEKGRILVGTQVLEQSLDIDADFLISRICPTDMLLQRIGRLWRHPSNMRPREAQREAWILTSSASEKDFGVTGIIYSPYVLYRTMEVWKPLKSINLPHQIRPLLEATYVDREEQAGLLEKKWDLEKIRIRLQRLALRAGAASGEESSDECASTRYSEIDTIEVLLVRGYQSSRYGVTVTLLNGNCVELSHVEKSGFRSRIAAQLKFNTLKVSAKQAPRAVAPQLLEWLKNYLYLGEGDEMLRVGIVSADGEVSSLDGESSGAYYDAQLGYYCNKAE